tara:strand:+ start:651 stop:827 length:177 start_codon:yes stop_codon:yes gene_type:complete
MDFNEWFYNGDDSGMSRFEYLALNASLDCDDVDALSALMEEAFNAGKEVGWTQAGDYL